MKVLHVITTFSVGGAERHLLDVTSQLAKEHDVTVAFFKEEAQEARSMVSDFRDAGMKVVNLKMEFSFDPRPYFRLSRLIKRLRPDVVHTHLYRADIAGIYLARWRRVPLVLASVHNLDLDTTYRRIRPLVVRAYKRAHIIVAISDAIGEVLCNEYGLKSDRVRTIHYGLDVARWIPRPSGALESAPIVGTIGRLAHQKAHEVLISAFRLVKDHVPDAQLKIVGHDDEGLRSELLEVVRSEGLADAVEISGFIDDVRNFLSEVAVFTLVSRWEGFGLVLLEAMAMERPVVATRVGPVPEIVVDGKTGCLVPVGDVGAVATAVTSLLQDPSAARQMGRAARARVVNAFSVEKMARQTLSVYTQGMKGA